MLPRHALFSIIQLPEELLRSSGAQPEMPPGSPAVGRHLATLA